MRTTKNFKDVTSVIKSILRVLMGPNNQISQVAKTNLSLLA